jgi:Ulp1 family protease
VALASQLLNFESSNGDVPIVANTVASSYIPSPFSLVGNVMHEGVTLDNGHYYADVLCNGSWIRVNDLKKPMCETVNLEYHNTQKPEWGSMAYVQIYVRSSSQGKSLLSGSSTTALVQEAPRYILNDDSSDAQSRQDAEKNPTASAKPEFMAKRDDDSQNSALIFDDKINDKQAGLHATKVIAVPKEKQVHEICDDDKGSSSDQDSKDSSSSDSTGPNKNKKRNRSKNDASPLNTQRVYAKSSYPLMQPTDKNENKLLDETFAAGDNQVVLEDRLICSSSSKLLAMDFKCLMTGEKINSETLNVYVLLVEDAAKNAGFKVTSFNSFFFAKLENVSWGIWGVTCLDLTLFVRMVLTA